MGLLWFRLCGMRITHALLLWTLLATTLSACTSTPTCVGLCYEDAWSKEPFTGETKQHIPTVDMRTDEQKQEPKDLNPCKDC